MMRYTLPAAIMVGGLGYIFWASLIPLPAFSSPVNARVFPTLVGIGLILAAGAMALERPAGDVADPEKVSTQRRDLTLWLGNLAVLLIYIIAFVPLGYILSTFLALTGLITFYSRGRFVTAAIVSAGFVAVTYVLFAHGLQIPLPRGLLSFLK